MRRWKDKKLLSQGEGIAIEFRESKNKINPSLYVAVCSFANRYGGHIIPGVSNK
ncbi:MAG: hypothetical protein FWF87_07585 [Synergistaceae bacterium]|nr:hypothetical protein [Synergistaceae bacterium]